MHYSSNPLSPHKSYYHCNSFIQAVFIAPLKTLYYSEALPTQHGYGAGTVDTVSEFHAEAPQATAREGLAQGIHVRGG